MNRVVITLNKHGEFDGVASDEPIQFYVYDPNCKSEPIYHYGAVSVGPHKVREIMKDHPIGYGGENIMHDRAPSTPSIKVIK